MSKTYFTGIRRWCAVMAIVVPLLCWGMFLMMALGARERALWPLILGGLLAMPFPLRPRKKASIPDRIIWCWMPWLMIALMYVWLGRQTEFLSFMDRVSSGEPLREWPVVTASLILVGMWMCQNWRAVRRLTDEDIFAFYEEKKGK